MPHAALPRAGCASCERAWAYVNLASMYAFLVFSLPLAIFLLDMLVYPRQELVSMRRAFVRGLVAALPIWLLSRIPGLVIPYFWGSPFLAVNEWLDRFLPYSILPALAYAVFYRYGERLGPGMAQRRLTSFYAGCLALFGLGEMTKAWGHPDIYTVMVLPFILAATTLAAPRIVLAALGSWGFRRAIIIGAGALVTLAAGCILPLFLAQLWPLALLLAGVLCASAWFLSAAGLFARPSAPLAAG